MYHLLKQIHFQAMLLMGSCCILHPFHIILKFSIIPNILSSLIIFHCCWSKGLYKNCPKASCCIFSKLLYPSVKNNAFHVKENQLNFGHIYFSKYLPSTLPVKTPRPIEAGSTYSILPFPKALFPIYPAPTTPNVISSSR